MMKFRLITLAILFLQIACNNITEKNQNESDEIRNEVKSKEDSSSYVDSSIKHKLVGFKKYDTELEYYKDIYAQEQWIPTDDILTLSIADSLFTEDIENELFYFVVFTKSMIGADGFYSETLAYNSYNFIITQTTKFAFYFLEEKKLNEKDLNNWAEYIYAEIQISREGEESQAIAEFEIQLLEVLKDSKIEYKNIIKSLINKIKAAHNIS